MDKDITVAAVAETAPTETERAIRRIVRDVLGQPAVGLDDDMFDHGATSLSFVRVLAEINRRFHVMVHAAELGGVASPRNLAACATRELAGSAIESKGA
jgi:acyl carrier protein